MSRDAKNFQTTVYKFKYHKKTERVKGIEPSSLPWQGNVIATILHPQTKLLPFYFYKKYPVRQILLF